MMVRAAPALLRSRVAHRRDRHHRGRHDCEHGDESAHRIRISLHDAANAIAARGACARGAAAVGLRDVRALHGRDATRFGRRDGVVCRACFTPSCFHRGERALVHADAPAARRTRAAIVDHRAVVIGATPAIVRPRDHRRLRVDDSRGRTTCRENDSSAFQRDCEHAVSLSLCSHRRRRPAISV